MPNFIQRLGQALPGLLDSPGLNLGIGLLAAGGPRPVGQGSGTGERLADALQFTTQRRAQSMELQAMREKLAQDKRNRELSGKVRDFIGLLGQSGDGPQQVGMSSAGRPVFRGANGEMFSEKSITVTHPDINGGRPTNIPSVFDGEILDDEEAAELVIKAGGKDPITGRALPGFDSIEEAVKAAKARSASLQITPTQTPSGLLGESQQQLLGLLAEADPAEALKAAGGLLGFGQQQGAARGLEGTFQAIEGRIGRKLTEEEAFELASRSGGGQSAIEMMQAQLGLMQQRFELEKAISERDEAGVKKARENMARQQALDTGIARALEIVSLNDSLEGTALEPGMAADIRGAAFSGLSLVDPKQRELVANFQRFSQVTGQEAIHGILDTLKNTGTISDTKFQALRGLSFGPNTGPETNRKAVADMLDTLFDSAETYGLAVRDRERIDRLRRELRSGKKITRLENGVTVEFLDEGQ